MDSSIYRAAQSGKWDDIQGIPTSAYSQRTATGNTVLHIVAQYSCDFPEEAAKHVLSQKSDMVFQTNSEGETPLHIAARRGHLDIVRALVDFQRIEDERLEDLLGAVDQQGNTAIHEAVSYNRYDVVELLLCATPKELSYMENCAGESPLYVAVERGNYEIVKLIVKLCKSPSYHGPERKTALHAAALRNSTECMELILKKIPLIHKEVNAIGWTALHYAAKNNSKNVVKLLLSKDKSMGYIAANGDDCVTALHVAATHGHEDVMHEIVSHCPNSWKMITSKRKNLLHLAVENEHQPALEFILESQWATELINEQDHKGNTPLHLYASTKSLKGHNLVIHPCVDKNVFNHDGFTPLGIIIQEEDDVLAERQILIKDELEKAGATPGLLHMITRLDEILSNDLKDIIKHPNTPLANGVLKNLESYMLVGTLVITVTFAAGFTVPGGYDIHKGNEAGMAVLSRKSAFSAFVVTDSLALMLACTSVFLQFVVMYRGFLPRNLFHYSKIFLILAIAFLVAAFLSGVYAVVPGRGIRIYLLVFGCWFGSSVAICLTLNLCKPRTREEGESGILKRLCNLIIENFA